ncbi:GSCOCG00012535001-RA-CDS [Cotesia congregata]|nr:GSCOCG00012535001-RA-CDS [Cotesia congregata]
MHNVAHLADDVEFTGLPTSQFSAYAFENFLGKIRKFIRSGHLPLAQFARRYLCEQKITRTKTPMKPMFEILKRQNYKIKALKYRSYFIRPTAPDNMVLLINSDVFEIRSIYQKDGLYLKCEEKSGALKNQLLNIHVIQLFVIWLSVVKFLIL